MSQQELLLKQLYLQLISEYPLSEIFFTNSYKTEEGVAVAAVSTKRIKKPFTCQLPDNSSRYTAELRAILLALKHVYYSKEKSFLILSDSLSSLQSILNLKYDHPVLVQILELYTEMTSEGREIVFIWVPYGSGLLLWMMRPRCHRKWRRVFCEKVEFFEKKIGKKPKQVTLVFIILQESLPGAR